MTELDARLKHEDTKLAAERTQHNAVAKDLILAQEEVMEFKRRVRVAVCLQLPSIPKTIPEHVFHPALHS